MDNSTPKRPVHFNLPPPIATSEVAPHVNEGTHLLDSQEKFTSTLDTLISVMDDDVHIYQRTKQVAEMLERTAFQLRKRISDYVAHDEKIVSRKFKRPERLSPKVTENIFIITLIWQVVCVAVMVFVGLISRRLTKDETILYGIGVGVMVLFQISNLVLSLAVTVKLTKQYIHRTASMKFLLDSYLSTLLLFGGLYTLIEKARPNAFVNVRGDRKSKTFALELYAQLMFTSISTGTLCGAATVVPVFWPAEIAMSFQMMLSFIYFASILSQVVSPSLEGKKKSDLEQSTVSTMSASIFSRRKKEKSYGALNSNLEV